MPSLLSVSWWRVVVGGLLVFAEAHYFLLPEMRAGYSSPTALAGARLIVGQVLVLAGGLWLLATGIVPRRGARADCLPLCCFIGGCVVKAGFMWHWTAIERSIDVLQMEGLLLAFSFENIGSEPGRGWDTAIPPLANQIGWWAVVLCVFGFECMAVAVAVRWVTRRMRVDGRRSPGGAGHHA